MLLVLSIAFSYVSGSDGPALAEPEELPKVTRLHEFFGRPRWHLNDIFTNRMVLVECNQEVRLLECPNTLTSSAQPPAGCRKVGREFFFIKFITMQFKVYTGRSHDEIVTLYGQRASSWCSTLPWDAWLQGGVKSCDVTISPFGSTMMAIVPQDDIFRARTFSAPLNCTINEHSSTSLQLIFAGLAGAILFFAAPPMAQSIAFRISVGGFLSVLLCSIIVAIFFLRYSSLQCECPHLQ
jgi:hypothetical protein